MYPLNLTEFEMMPYPPFDNQSSLIITGMLNGTESIALNTTGYVSAVVEVRGMDIIMFMLGVIMCIQIALVALAIWHHYIITWGGKKYQ